MMIFGGSAPSLFLKSAILRDDEKVKRSNTDQCFSSCLQFRVTHFHVAYVSPLCFLNLDLSSAHNVKAVQDIWRHEPLEPFERVRVHRCFLENKDFVQALI